MMDQVQHLKLMTMEYYLRIFSTATIIYHPLYLKELVATAGLLEKSFHDMQLSNKLVDLCSLFFTMQEETIYFIHQSVKDYFSTSKGSKIFPLG